jgi:hypothetical protein
MTFVNPYFVGVWREVLSSVLDNQLRWRIMEWMPAISMVNFSMVLYLPVTAIFLWKHKKIFSLDKIVIYIFLLIESMLSRRHLPLFALYSYPLTTLAFIDFFNVIKRIKFAPMRFNYVYKIFYFATLLLIFLQLTMDVKELTYISENNYYPQRAIEFLKNRKIEGNLFSDYAWGGYLIWKYPEEKVFIDGRMPSWRSKNYAGNQSVSAMDDYENILKGREDYKLYFNKYNIRYILWPKEKYDKIKDNKFANTKIGNGLKKLLKLKDGETPFPESAIKDGWVKIYEDNISYIFSKSR